MGTPLRIALLTLLAPALAFAGDVVDDSSGTKITFTDAWRHMPEYQQGSRTIVLVNSVEDGKYVQFTVDVGSADNFDAGSWLKGQKMSVGEKVADMAEMKIDKNRTIGGLAATGYSTAGKLNGVPIRLRSYIVKNGTRAVVMQEISFNGAHETIGDEALDKFWEGISFQEAVASVGGENPAAPEAPAEPTPVEDKAGNFKLVLPPKWALVHKASTPDMPQRGVFERFDDRGDRVLQVGVIRWEIRDPSMFKQSMSQVAEWVVKRDLFSIYYGEGSRPMLLRSLRIDESQGVSGVSNTCGFMISSRSMQEIEDTREAEDKKRKGIKGVVVPDYKPTVVRARIAALSPHIYLVFGQFRSDVADNEQIQAEWKKIVDSFELLETSAKPPALTIPLGGGQVVSVGNTIDDETLGKRRKFETMHSMKGKRNLYEAEWTITLPPGFKALEKKVQSETAVCVVVAQDSKNRWLKMTVNAVSKRARNSLKPANTDLNWSPNGTLETWKSNWESRARGDRVRDDKNIRIGRLKGKGYELEGEIEGWPATFTCLVGDESQWRVLIEVETRGGFAKEYRKEMRQLMKSLRMRDKS